MKTLAEKFINRVRKNTDYNVNIMNKSGIIIASKDSDRVGQFHEQAYRIINEKSTEYVIHEKDRKRYVGNVKTGITRPIMLNGEIIGAVGVTGTPEDLDAVSRVMQIAVETMYEYEYRQEQKVKTNSLRDRFVHMVLYENPPDLQSMRDIADMMGWLENLPRQCIYLSVDIQADTSKVIQNLKNSSCYSSQDIISPVKEQDIVIFKSYMNINKEFSEYKNILDDFFKNACCYLDNVHSNYRIYVGSIQKSFSKYCSASNQCRWLRQTYTDKINYFYDHLDHYLMSSIDYNILDEVFQIFFDIIQENEIDSFQKNMTAMYNNNYNMNETCKELFIHKNTLAYQFNKVRQALNMDPLHSSRERAAIEALLYYFKETRPNE